MLSDEEKKAIEYLKQNSIVEIQYDNYGLESIHRVGIDEKQTILNLIEKQSKEIEELKMQLEVEKIDNKYNQEETYEETIPRYKLKEVLEKYKYTEVGNSEKIIEFYKELQLLLEKE